MFISFEGPEGAGKSSVIKVLAEELRAQGHEVTTTREPGAGEVGRKIRDVLLHGENIDPKTELMLYLADRSENVAKVIRPALEGGRIVLCDRYSDSTVVYQGYARGFDIEELRRQNSFVTGGLVPDLTLLLDIDPAVGLERIEIHDRLDREPLAFHQAVRSGFLAEAVRDSIRWVKVNASMPLSEVVAVCREAISSRLKV